MKAYSPRELLLSIWPRLATPPGREDHTSPGDLEGGNPLPPSYAFPTQRIAFRHYSRRCLNRSRRKCLAR